MTDLESAAREHDQHRQVVAERQRPERLETLPGRLDAEVFEQRGRNPPALKLVVDREGDLGGRIVDADVRADADDVGPANAGAARKQRQSLAAVGHLAEPLQQLRRGLARREEALIAALGRKPVEETLQGAEIAGVSRSQRGHRAVLEDNTAERLLFSGRPRWGDRAHEMSRRG